MNLKDMTVKQLDRLIADATELRNAKRLAEREALKADVQRRLAEHGLTPADVFGTGKRGTPKGTKVAVKYRDKANPENTWTGRGRQPLWLVAAIKSGRKIESFAVGAGHAR